MSPVTHFLTGWVLANAADLNRRDRVVVTLAAVVPSASARGSCWVPWTRRVLIGQFLTCFHLAPDGFGRGGGQWKLDAWPNIALTIALLFVTVWMAVKRGFSPVDTFSPTADRSVVAALRKRFQTTDLTA
jgi:hypothetical protein